MTAPIDITALTDAARKADQGPWDHMKGEVFTSYTDKKGAIWVASITDPLEVEDGAFIALANPATILRLCAELEAARLVVEAADMVLASAQAGPSTRSSVSIAMLDDLVTKIEAYDRATTAGEKT